MQLLKNKLGRIQVESHRGVEHTHPENSWPGIKAAHDEGADFIELDVQISADGIPFLHHNYQLLDGRWIHETNWSELEKIRIDEQPLPRLDKVLEWAREKDAVLSLDIKPGFHPFGQLGKQVAELLQAGDGWEHAMLLSWDHQELKAIKAGYPQATTRITLFARLADIVSEAQAANCNAVSLAYGVARPEDVEQLHDNGLAVALGGMWDFDLETVRNLDVDIVCWGHPLQARQFLGYI